MGSRLHYRFYDRWYREISWLILWTYFSSCTTVIEILAFNVFVKSFLSALSPAVRVVSIRLQGKKLAFVTNNSTKSRKQYADKFLGLGLSVSEVKIFFFKKFLDYLPSHYMAVTQIQFGYFMEYFNHRKKYFLHLLLRRCSWKWITSLGIRRLDLILHGHLLLPLSASLVRVTFDTRMWEMNATIRWQPLHLNKISHHQSKFCY